MDKVESFTHEGKTVTLYYDQDCTNPREFDGHFLWLGLPHRRYNIGDEQLPTSFQCHTCDGTGLADPDREPVTGEGADCLDCDGAGYCEAGDKGFDLVAWLTKEHKALLVVPVGLIDRSGVSFYLGGGAHWSDSQGWDSGTCGFLVFTEQMSTDWGLTDLYDARKQMKAELDEYNSWNSGDWYGYVVTEPGRTAAGIIKDVEVEHPDILDILSITTDEYDRLCDEPGTEPVKLAAGWGFIGYDYAVKEAKAAIGLTD